MQANTEDLKKIIKRELKRKGISIKDLASKLSLSPRFFSEMKCIKIERLMSICNVTGISIYQFIDDDNFDKFYNKSGELIKIDRI